MYRTLLKAKIHRAVVTSADLHYEGSITIDAALLEASGIREYERVQVVDIENGARFETYVIAGEPGSGTIQLNGAAARLVNVGDRIIIMSYALVPEPLPTEWQPKILLLDEDNRIK
jgi:aspartate 1-decarboxylase